MILRHYEKCRSEIFDDFMLPYYKKVIPYLKAKGIIPFIDSDGDITQGMSWFKKAGIEGVLPLERQAGVNLFDIRKEHPDVRFIGHFDKMIMHKGKEALRTEFERLLPVVKQGGYIISVDHQTSPGVSYDQYRDYITLLKEYSWKCGT